MLIEGDVGSYERAGAEQFQQVIPPVSSESTKVLEEHIRRIFDQARLATRDRPAEPAHKVGGLAAWQLRKVYAYLEPRLAEKVTVPVLAALLSLSPNHFCTAFRQSTGEPPYRYLLLRRLNRAQALLWSDPEKSITEVALSVGFGSSAHFATSFRRELGLSPSEWRHQRP